MLIISANKIKFGFILINTIHFIYLLKWITLNYTKLRYIICNKVNNEKIILVTNEDELLKGEPIDNSLTSIKSHI